MQNQITIIFYTSAEIFFTKALKYRHKKTSNEKFIDLGDVQNFRLQRQHRVTASRRSH